MSLSFIAQPFRAELMPDLTVISRMLSAKTTAFFLVLFAMAWTATSAPASQKVNLEVAEARSLILPDSINFLSFPALSAVMRSFFSLIVAGLAR